MGKGGLNHPNPSLQEYSWEDIVKHSSKTDRWVVIQGHVYDVTNWVKRHPGGERIISYFAGQDATEAWTAFHMHTQAKVSKYMQPLLIGKVKEEDGSECRLAASTSESVLLDDFRKLRKVAEDMQLFKPSVTFFVSIMAHILFCDFMGWLILWKCGTGWIPYVIAAVFLTIGQAQAGWSQHDYGHLSVFKSSRWNHITQIFVLNFIKGASTAWWNYRHNIHHAKPNVIRKDPDIRLDMFFLTGKVLPKEWGKKKKGFMPYHKQHQYFYFILPPLLLPLYFNFEIPYFLITRKCWMELFWMGTFFVRWQLMFSPVLGFWGVFGLFLFVRFLESHWFVWATQMSHLPMAVEYDKEGEDWVTTQLKASCNVRKSWFNDWWSGHLNFQIEHHLFPTMPRHNLYKIAPLVQTMCKKHGLEYQNKSLFTAWKDIIGSLKDSGQMWLEAYDK